MKNLIRLIIIANKLDKRGLTKEADVLDSVARKFAQHDKEWEMLSKDDTSFGDEELDALLQEYEDQNPIDEPSDAELGAMEMGVDVFKGDEDNAYQSMLDKLMVEMELFSEAAGKGMLTADDVESFEQIKQELEDVKEIIRQRKMNEGSFIPEA